MLTVPQREGSRYKSAYWKAAMQTEEIHADFSQTVPPDKG